MRGQHKADGREHHSYANRLRPAGGHIAITKPIATATVKLVSAERSGWHRGGHSAALLSSGRKLTRALRAVICNVSYSPERERLLLTGRSGKADVQLDWPKVST